MVPASLSLSGTPRLPSRGRAVMLMAAFGAMTGLASSLPSPFPDIHLSDPDILVNAQGVPLHAGLAFGALVAGSAWIWVSRDLAKCLLALLLALMGWLAAINTAHDVVAAVQASDLFGKAEGAKASREVLGWLAGGAIGGAIGAGLTAFAVGIPALSLRRAEAWLPVVIVGGALGLLLYPAAQLDAIALLFVPWQAAVAAAIAFGLTAPERQGADRDLAV
jgi:hypothetical protein